jgi:hypothetical protein
MELAMVHDPWRQGGYNADSDFSAPWSAWKRQRDVLFEVAGVRAVRGWCYNITGINARENSTCSIGQVVT